MGPDDNKLQTDPWELAGGGTAATATSRTAKGLGPGAVAGVVVAAVAASAAVATLATVVVLRRRHASSVSRAKLSGTNSIKPPVVTAVDAVIDVQ